MLAPSAMLLGAVFVIARSAPAAAVNVAPTAKGGVAVFTTKLHVVAVGFAHEILVHPENVAVPVGVSVSVTVVPSAYPDVHVPVCVPPVVFVQLIVFAFAVSFTFPGPVTVTFTVPPPDVNPTSAVVAADIPNAQLTALLNRQLGVVPVHPKKVDPAPAVTESVTRVPAPKFVMQVPLVVVPTNMQLIPAGALVTVPPPVCIAPACTVNGNVPLPGLNVAVTVSAAVIVN